MCVRLFSGWLVVGCWLLVVVCLCHLFFYGRAPSQGDPKLRPAAWGMAACGILIYFGQLFLSLRVVVAPKDSGVAIAIYTSSGFITAGLCW